MVALVKTLEATVADFSFPVNKLIVALSGGCDSMSLLYALKSSNLHYPVEAWHVNHGLQADAALWEQACQAFCERQKIPFRCFHLHLSPQKGESIEAVARDGRYRAFENHLLSDNLLLIAHTQDDQAETVLLQLLRGAGPKGLAGIPMSRPLGQGRLLRPWLTASREMVHQYAKANQLTWIEDPSNTVLDFDRNFLRHQILPVLKARFPGMMQSVSRSAQHCGAAEVLLNQLAKQDLNFCVEQKASLSVASLKTLPDIQRNNVLRFWLAQQGLSLPSTKKLFELQRQMLEAKPDKNPCVTWKGGRVRRYQGELMADVPQRNGGFQTRPVIPLTWDYAAPLTLWAGQMLKGTRTKGKGLSLKTLASKSQVALTVMPRQGGERCRPAGHNVTRSVKKLFQAHNIPSWERANYPLIYCGDQLIAIPGIMIQSGWEVSELSGFGLELSLVF